MLLNILRNPGAIPALSLTQWDLLLRQARRERLLAHLGWLLREQGLQDQCPEPALEQMRAYQIQVDYLHVQTRREVRAIRRVLDQAGIPLLLLKGSAYLFLDLPFAHSRRFVDLDVLLPEERLAEAEQRLVLQGWQFQNLNAYDQRYYRDWMHEIPPMRYPSRVIEVDIHHRLLPRTSRLHPNSQLLWEQARALPEAGLYTLAPMDMLLHSATHLFYDGDLSGGLRELVDLHELLRQFGQEPGFWNQLPGRAQALQLTLPLYYALRAVRQLLGSSIPDQVLKVLAPAFPESLVRSLTLSLAQRVLSPRGAGRPPPISAWLLYLRSHWLRMPPWLLARHLAHKSWWRVRGGAEI